jgi:hypothetical protein
MMPFTSYKISSYIQCLKRNFDEKTAYPLSFLASIKGDIDGFYVADGSVYYRDFIYVPIEGNCSELVKTVEGYDPREIRSLAYKLLMEVKYKKSVNYNEREMKLKKVVLRYTRDDEGD